MASVRRLRGFQVLEDQPLAHALKLLPDTHLPRRQIDVIPSKAGGFPEAQPTGKGHREQGGETMLSCCDQKGSGLINFQRRDRSRRGLRPLHKRSGIDRDELESLSVCQSGS
jgi:hypothetical protein